MKSTILNQTLLANALFSFVSGLLLVVFTDKLSQLMGIILPTILSYVGIALFSFVLLLLFIVYIYISTNKNTQQIVLKYLR